MHVATVVPSSAGVKRLTNTGLNSSAALTEQLVFTKVACGSYHN